ncbi:MAG: hypothetical protein HXY37_11250 [Chloroflexi bacterium]|nr:hypothetical protein [Chloroflexota bacterium]
MALARRGAAARRGAGPPWHRPVAALVRSAAMSPRAAPALPLDKLGSRAAEGYTLPLDKLGSRGAEG